MPSLDLVLEDFESKRESVSRNKLSNLYTVQNPVSISSVSYVPRPVLTHYATLSSTPAISRGLWYEAKGGSLFVYAVTGTTLYKVTSPDVIEAVGTIPGSGKCTFANTMYYTAIVSDGNLFLYDGSTVIPVEVPDLQEVEDITSLDNYLIIAIKNSSKYYWITPGATEIDPLSFASSERNPDDIVSVATLGDELWQLGQETVEIFTDSGEVDAPFVRISGRVYSTGCASKTSVVKTLKNSLPCLIWITPNKEVVLAQGDPSKISNESVEELLKTVSEFNCWSFRVNKHDFYIINTTKFTLVYDITQGRWCRWSTYQKETWDALFGINIRDTVLVLDEGSNIIYSLSQGTEDAGSEYLICEVSGFIPNTSSSSVPCNVVNMFMAYGIGSSYVTPPTIEMRWSDDGGKTWSAYLQASQGLQGSYTSDVSFRSLGRINKPGRYFEFRFSESQSFRLDGVLYND